ncbi:MAG: DNA-binding response regulator [Archangium gephyra]|uniref:DNA-binding response regulator n=1 Tax=Archangium gephyra TaxID=48 RepID=A0A2W5VJ85_9BACT|nr:MAG: DNA-binding response regulator [Archangium gephyra]
MKVLLADDQHLVRSGLKMILEARGFEVIAEAANGADAVTLATSLRPDVCLFDIRMPVMDGIEATRRVAAQGLAVIVITTFDLDEYVFAALKAGARGFLLKDAGPELLVQGLQAAASGEALLSPKTTARLLERFAQLDPGKQQPFEPLTEREEDVLRTLARGQTNEEIAATLNISLSTVKTHVASLMGKLDVRNRVELALWAWETGRARTFG